MHKALQTYLLWWTEWTGMLIAFPFEWYWSNLVYLNFAGPNAGPTHIQSRKYARVPPMWNYGP